MKYDSARPQFPIWYSLFKLVNPSYFLNQEKKSTTRTKARIADEIENGVLRAWNIFASKEVGRPREFNG